MCEPISATTAMYIALGSAAAGAYGAYQQAEGQKNMYEYQSKVADNNAKVAEYAAMDAKQRGEFEAMQIERRTAQEKGALRVQQAAAGLDLNNGSVAALQDQVDFFGQQDKAIARSNAEKNVWGARVQAGNARSEAGMLRTAADNISPTDAAAMSLISSAGQVASKWYTPTSGGNPGFSGTQKPAPISDLSVRR